MMILQQDVNEEIKNAKMFRNIFIDYSMMYLDRFLLKSIKTKE